MKVLAPFICVLCLWGGVGCRKNPLLSKPNSLGDQQGQKLNNPNSSALFGKWPENQFPLNINVSEDFNDEERQHIIMMVQEWEQKADLPWPLFDSTFERTVNPAYTSLPDYHDGELGIYKGPDWFPEVGRSTLAITQFFGRRTYVGTPAEYIELEHADIIINSKEFSFSTASPPSSGSYDLASVVLHELGHFLGLPHERSSAPSVMVPSLSPSKEKRHLQDVDRKNIRKTYLGASAQGLSANTLPLSRHEGDYVYGYIELKADGTCETYSSGSPLLLFLPSFLPFPRSL